MNQPLSKTITLPDGRLLGYSEYGDLMGEPIFYFHGFPGSRLEAAPFDEIAQAGHCRLIAIDRPGMGLSTPQPKRTLLSWASDVKSLADKLSIEKFSIMGHSGGAPFVAACAYQLSTRLKSIGIIAGVASLAEPKSKEGMATSQRVMNFLIKKFPFVTLFMMRMTYRMLNKPNSKMMQGMIKKLPEPDQAIWRDANYSDNLIRSTLEAFRQGAKWPAEEMKLLFRPWGFQLNKITCPLVIWHGSLDTQVPLSHAYIYADQIPKATLKIVPNEGHDSLLRNHIANIMECVVDAKEGRAS